jgi:hypothetical protein
MHIKVRLKDYTEKLNEFSELLKEVSAYHEEHNRQMSQQHGILVNYHNHVVAQAEITAGEEIKENLALQAFTETCFAFEKQMIATHAMFKIILKDTNAVLGSYSNQWGSHLEQVAVSFFLEHLRSEFGVHTWFQKFKRYWHKSKNVELDLLAHNDQVAYIVEVKNQLKIEHLLQIDQMKLKLDEHAPEFKHLKKQFIMMCLHCEPQMMDQFDDDIWIMKYREPTDNESAAKSWEWVKRIEQI